MVLSNVGADILNQLRFDCGRWARHGRRMQDAPEGPRNLLVIAIFSTIIGLISYAGFMH
jgi:hypothetical protein